MFSYLKKWWYKHFASSCSFSVKCKVLMKKVQTKAHVKEAETRKKQQLSKVKAVETSI